MFIKKTTMQFLLASLMITISVTSFAHSTIHISRYQTVAVKPTTAQASLLQQQIQIKFPKNVLTIQEAIHFMLQFSGYRLAKPGHEENVVQQLLRQPLPEVDRNFGPVTLQQGLNTLAGSAFTVLVDPVHRLISFQLKSHYKLLYPLT